MLRAAVWRSAKSAQTVARMLKRLKCGRRDIEECPARYAEDDDIAEKVMPVCNGSKAEGCLYSFMCHEGYGRNGGSSDHHGREMERQRVRNARAGVRRTEGAELMQQRLCFGK